MLARNYRIGMDQYGLGGQRGCFVGLVKRTKNIIPRHPSFPCELGKFVVTGTQTVVLEGLSIEDVWSILVKFSRFVDDSHNMLVDMFHQTFEERIVEIKQIHKLDWLVSKKMGVQLMSGALDEDVRYVPDVLRSILRSMTLFSGTLHAKNWHTKGFSEENLVFEGEELMFYNITISKAVDAQMDNRVRRDFGCLAVIVRRIFSGRFGVLPPELNIWIDTLLTVTRESTAFLVDNVATVSASDREYFIRKIVERKAGIGWRFGTSVLPRVVHSSYRQNWWEEVKPNNGALMHTLMHENQFDPQTGQVVNKYMKNNRLEQLLRFCHNFYVHGGEAEVHPWQKFDEVDLDAMIFYKFGEELSNLQSTMNEFPEVRQQFK